MIRRFGPLRHLRVRRDMTVRQAAAQLRVAPSTVHAWECGDRAIGVAQLADLLEAYGATAAERHELLEALRLMGCPQGETREDPGLFPVEGAA